MKRIAFFLDGTWNRADSEYRTFVARFSEALAPRGADEVEQVVFYQAGVGTGRGAGTFAKLLDTNLGGVFGLGLDENIHAAYRFLVRNYAYGDEIYIFGFSRGAYTARCLVGLIRSAGIIDKTHLFHSDTAMALYRRRNPPETRPPELKEINPPDWPEYMQFRADHAPDTATSQAEFEWRVAQGLPSRPPIKIAYLGLFDTVASFGLAGVMAALRGEVTSYYDFHDKDLSSMVRAARHAVALDEHRKHFKPTLWTNIEKLNRDTDAEGAPYKELWFAGTHAILGGSHYDPGLSYYPGKWIAEGAMKAGDGAGLTFDESRLAATLGTGYIQAPLPAGRNAAGFMNLFGRFLEPRKAPEVRWQVDDSVLEKMRATDYIPGARPWRFDA